MNEKLNADDIGIKPKGFLAWLDNFWYHYKWHSIAALFLIFTITICSFQMCQKESYDMYILYAGNHAFSRQSVDADTPEYIKAKNTLSRFVSDYDENGKINISLRDLFIPKEEEMGDLNESQYSRAYEDRTSLSTLMVSGEHFICFLAPEIYEYYKDSGWLIDIRTILPADSGVQFCDDSGKAVPLASTALSSLAGFSELPDDTVICLRTNGMSSLIERKASQKAFENAQETLVKMLNY